MAPSPALGDSPAAGDKCSPVSTVKIKVQNVRNPPGPLQMVSSEPIAVVLETAPRHGAAVIYSLANESGWDCGERGN